MWTKMLSFFGPVTQGLDPYIFQGAQGLTGIVGRNIITISLCLLMLKFIAKKTPWAGDDKIHQILTGAFAMIRSGNLTPETIEKLVEDKINETATLPADQAL